MLALICLNFPSVWHTVHAMSLYEEQGLYSSFAMEENNGILLTLSFTSDPSSETSLPHLFMLPLFCDGYLDLQLSVGTSYSCTASQGAPRYGQREKPVVWSLVVPLHSPFLDVSRCAVCPVASS